MKKKYVKPELFYEHYELSQHIADCAWEWVNNEDPAVCYAEADKLKIPMSLLYPSYNLFVSEATGCTVFSDKYLDFCYQNGGPSANLFKS